MLAETETTAPTAAEMDTALVFTADGYSDDDGVDHVTVASKAVAAAETAPGHPAVVSALDALEADLIAAEIEWHDKADLTDSVRAEREGREVSAEDEAEWQAVSDRHWAAVDALTEYTPRTPAELLRKARLLTNKGDTRLRAEEQFAELYLKDAEAVSRMPIAASEPIAIESEVPSLSWGALLATYREAQDAAEARGIEVDAAFAQGSTADEVERDAAGKAYEAALCRADALLETIVDRPVEAADQLVIKHQLAADRWLLGNKGETLTDRHFVNRIASEKEATRWIMGRVHQDLQRLAGIEGECRVARQAARFAEAVVRHRQLDGAKGAIVEAECAAQWHTMIAAEVTAQADTPTSRAGVAFQLLCAVGEIDTVENGGDDDAKEEAAEKIRFAVANAIAALGLPFDAETAQFFLGDRLAKGLAQ